MAGRVLKLRRSKLFRRVADAPFNAKFVSIFMLAAVILCILAVGAYMNKPSYNLSSAAATLVGDPDRAVLKELTYNTKKETYYFNKGGLNTKTNSAQIGNNYSATLADKLTNGLTIYDDTTGLSFTMAPEISALAGKTVDGHIVYPTSKAIQAVYTVMNNGLKEDIVLNRNIGNTLELKYRLQLPSDLVAREMSGGAVGIYSADPVLFSHMSYGTSGDQKEVLSDRIHGAKNHLVFAIVAPIINESNGILGGKQTKASAKLTLNGDILSVNASGLDGLSYPVSVDPSVVVTSASMAGGNNSGDISFSGGQASEANLDGGSNFISGFTNTTALGQTTPGTTTGGQAADYNSVVAYNGYLYSLGAYNGGVLANDAYYISLSDPTLASNAWNTTNNINSGTGVYKGTAVAYNGYMYYVGGCSSSCGVNTVYYTAVCTGSNINDGCTTSSSPGSLGTWQTTITLPYKTSIGGAVAYNGYLYEVGGCESGSGSTCPTANVYYTQINANGTIGGTSGTWQTATSLPVATDWAGVVAYNGYIYEIGGNETGGITANVYDAPINSNGSLGSWNPSASPVSTLPATLEYETAFAYNGYLYTVGGYNGTSRLAEFRYASINADGTLGPWITASALNSTTQYLSAAAYNGYVYTAGGYTGSPTSLVEYTELDPEGSLGPWNTDPTTSPYNTLPYYVDNEGVTVYNGYIYVIGGCASATAIASCSATNATASVSYALICNSTNSGTDGCAGTPGDIGDWNTTTSLPNAVYFNQASAYNGYVYSFGGENSSGVTVNEVDYAAICTGTNTNGGCTMSSTSGSLGTWNYGLGLASQMVNAEQQGAAQIWDGYVNYAGGTDIGGSSTDQVQYTAICTGTNTIDGCTTSSQPGSLGTWSAPSGYTISWSCGSSCRQSYNFYGGGSAVYAGYFYLVGNSYGAGTNTVYAAICTGYNTNLGCSTSSTPGTLGNWQESSVTLPQTIYTNTVVVDNGWLYSLGGDNGTNRLATVYFAPINSDGSIGSWITDSNNGLALATRYANGVAWDGYLFDVAGATTGGDLTNTVEYALVNSSGSGQMSVNSTGSSLTYGTDDAATTTYGNYIYEIGGCSTSSCPSSAVYYDNINQYGSMGGSWTSSGHTLPASIDQASAVAYNNYLYVIGGNNGSVTNIVYYAPIGSSGSVGTWCSGSCGTLPGNTEDATLYVYDGYLFVVGGNNGTTYSSSIYEAPINSNGSVGTWTTLSTGTPVAVDWASGVTYSGYLYLIGGYNASGAQDNVYSAAVCTGFNSGTDGCGSVAGTLGTWQQTTSLPDNIYQGAAVAGDGYIYEIGGCASTCPSTAVYYAPISGGGELGPWAQTMSLSQATDQESAVEANGFAYTIGGYNGSTELSNVQYAGIDAMPRIGYYSVLLDLSGSSSEDPEPYELTTLGSNVNNAGIGGLSDYGGVTTSYAFASNSCSIFNPTSLTQLNSTSPINTAYALSLPTTNPTGCSGSPDNLFRYAWVSYVLDDSQTATFPDVDGNHTTLTSINLYYHPATQGRLRGGQTFSNGGLQSLDAPPTPGAQ